MNGMIRAWVTACIVFVSPGLAAVQTYDFPTRIPGISASTRWSMTVDGTPIRVMQLYTMGTNTYPSPDKDNSGPGAVAMFAMEGPVTVKLTTDETITSYDIRPRSLGIEATVSGNTLTFTLKKPGHCGVEINKNFAKPLFIFSNPPETNKPDPKDPNVTFFEKGNVHDIGAMKLTGLKNHTVYLEGGAVLLGNLNVGGKDYTVRGHGVLYSGPDSTNGSSIFVIGRSTNVTIRDFTTITHRDGNYGSTVYNSDTVSFTNWRMLNTAKDGLNPMGTQNMLVDSCFIFGDDDASAIKTSRYTTQDAAFITFQNSQIWNNSIEIGYETHGGDIHDITYKNLDIIHVRQKSEHPNYPLNEMSIHVNDIGTVYNVLYEDIRIESSLSNRFFEFRIIYVPYAAYPKNSGSEWRGHIRDVYLENIRVIDSERFPKSVIGGWDADHLVENLGIEGLFVNGRQILDATAGKVEINEYTHNVGFIPLGRGDKVPAAPTGLSVVGTTSTSVSLSWTDASDNEWGFTIERSEGNSTFEVIDAVNYNATTFTDNNSLPSSKYTYRVRSSNRSGFSTQGSTVVVTTPAPTGAGPAAVTALSATAPFSISARLTWSHDKVDLVGFIVKRSKSGSQSWVVLDTLGRDETVYTDVPLIPGTGYQYRLIAFNHNGQAAPVSTTVTTPQSPALTTITDSMADKSYWFESANWETFSSANAANMEGDVDRARRVENVLGTITYAFANISDFEVVLYHQRTLQESCMRGSSNYRDWYGIACDIVKTQSTVDNTWYKSVLTPMTDSIHAGTHFLRLEVGVNSANWNPQLSQVTLTYGGAQAVGSQPVGARPIAPHATLALAWQDASLQIRHGSGFSTLRLFDLQGRVVWQRQLDGQAGVQTIERALFPAGSRLIEANSVQGRTVVKLLVR
jgi:fibronectin type 3 domain-containing protein